MLDLSTPLILAPNLRWEDATATTGYTWGKPASESNILKMLPGDLPAELGITNDDIVAERWIATDDQANPSLIITESDPIPLSEAIAANPEALLGEKHIAEYGPYLNCIMKQLDTHPASNRGGLSVQIHPKPNHPTRPAKPEMWRGTGSVYLGWKATVSEETIEAAMADNALEELMNLIELTPDKPVIVPGGAVHAIRANTFLMEWSKAPGADDIAKGNIKDASVALYDRTDGKTPRPGKEDLPGSFEIMHHADSFTAQDLDQAFATPTRLDHQAESYTLTALFRTPQVFVNHLQLEDSFELNLQKRGLPLFVEHGTIDVYSGNEHVDQIHPGDERFFPAALKHVTLKLADQSLNAGSCYWWYAPVAAERKSL